MNKIATLRNSRGGDIPNVVQCSRDLILYGAEGITIHPRPDQRHIRREDVYDLAELLKKTNSKRKSDDKIEFNIEGYPNEEFFKFLEDTRPDQATLVPDPPDVLTSNAGWALAKNEAALVEVLRKVHRLGVRSSLFVDVYRFDEAEEKALARLKPDRIELYTERFAVDYQATSARQRKKSVTGYARVARIAEKLGIEVNAGHDLTSNNVGFLLKNVSQIIECSIGHALIAESLYLGFEKTIAKYKKAMRAARV